MRQFVPLYSNTFEDDRRCGGASARFVSDTKTTHFLRAHSLPGPRRQERAPRIKWIH